jgi:hypothetical protein
MGDHDKRRSGKRPLIAVAVGIAVYLMALTMAFGLDPSARHLRSENEASNVTSATPGTADNQQDLATAASPAGQGAGNSDVTTAASPGSAAPGNSVAAPDVTTAPSPSSAPAPSTAPPAPDVLTAPSPAPPSNPAQAPAPTSPPDVVTSPSPGAPSSNPSNPTPGQGTAPAQPSPSGNQEIDD